MSESVEGETTSVANTLDSPLAVHLAARDALLLGAIYQILVVLNGEANLVDSDSGESPARQTESLNFDREAITLTAPVEVGVIEVLEFRLFGKVLQGVGSVDVFITEDFSESGCLLFRIVVRPKVVTNGGSSVGVSFSPLMKSDVFLGPPVESCVVFVFGSVGLVVFTLPLAEVFVGGICVKGEHTGVY